MLCDVPRLFGACLTHVQVSIVLGAVAVQDCIIKCGNH
jgi:hypothetical protein